MLSIRLTNSWPSRASSLASAKLQVGYRPIVQNIVEQDGNDASIDLYAGELFYDTTDGHLWVGDGNKQIKIDPRAIVAYENESVFYENEVVLF